MIAHLGLGALHLRRGDVTRAISHLETGVGIIDEFGLPVYFRYFAPALGLAYALAGRVNEGLAMVERALQQDRTQGIMAHHASTLVTLGEVHRLAGCPAEAASAARQALTLSCDRHEPGHEAYAHRLLGELARDERPPNNEVAGYHFREALFLAERQGMRPLVAHCHLGLGTLYRRIGKREPAREHLTTATTMYREMDMRFWLAQAEAV